MLLYGFQLLTILDDMMISKKFIITLVLSIICLTNSAQTIYNFNGKCQLELPNKLELQFSELNAVKKVTAQNKS